MAALSKGSKAPDIHLPLIGGGEFSLKQSLSRGAVVVAFFKISCPVCQYSAPFFDRLAQQLKSAGVTMVGISQDDQSSTVDFMKQFGVHFPVALDTLKSYPASNAYGLTNVPTLFEIEQDGTIAVSSVGWAREDVEAIHKKYVAHNSSAAPLFQKNETIADFRAG